MSILMKILFLNPQIGADHGLVKDLQAKGIAALTAPNADEAWKMLRIHGSSVDLAVVHRESPFGQNNDGALPFLQQLKADPQQADLPVVLTSSFWKDEEFAQHQNSPQGANAYLSWPLASGKLMEVIDGIFGSEEQAEVASPVAEPVSEPSSAAGEFEFSLEAPPVEAPSSEPSPEISLEGPSIASEPAESGPTEVSIEFSSPVDLSMEGPAGSGEGAISLDSAESGALEFTSADLKADVPAPPEATAVLDLEKAEAPIDLGPVPESPSKVEEAFASPPEAESIEFGADQELADEMPYLFGKQERMEAEAVFAQPVGDAVVPGGAAQAPDLETFKKYLLLREQDVAVLSAQLAAAKQQNSALEKSLREEKGKNAELTHVASEYQRKIGEFEKGQSIEVENLQKEVADLKFQLRTKGDKARLLEAQVREASDEIDRLKERVRSDIRKIRVREKELENRLEIMKKDSEALIAARENKIIELKRKIDLLEFNMDLLQDQYTREKESASRLRDRLAKAAQVVRVAGGLLDTDQGGDTQSDTEATRSVTDREAS